MGHRELLVDDDVRFDPEVVQRVLSTRRADDPLGRLSSRERTVPAMIAEGLSNQAIAERLVLTDRTVEAHVRSLLTKRDLPPGTGIHRRVMAVLTHLRSGRRPPGPDGKRKESVRTRPAPGWIRRGWEAWWCAALAATGPRVRGGPE